MYIVSVLAFVHKSKRWHVIYIPLFIRYSVGLVFLFAGVLPLGAFLKRSVLKI